jgi:hypothetical protein
VFVFFSAKLGYLVNFFQEKIILNDFQKNNFKWFSILFFPFLEKGKIKMAISKMDPI